MNDLAKTKKVTPFNTMRDLLEKQKEQIAMALPQHMTPQRLIRVSLTALRRTPRLLKCSQASVLGSIISAAQLGLETDGALGHAYLVPYKNECQLQIGYRGMIDLARRSGQIVSISARVVYEKDVFKYTYGLNETLQHEPHRGDKGKPVAVYAVAKLVGGGHQFEVLDIEQINAAKNASPYSNSSSSPWVNHWDEMARKTAVRRLFKYLPVSIEIQRAVGLDDMASAGIPQHLDSLVVESEVINVEPTGNPIETLKKKLTSKNEKDIPTDESAKVDTIADIYDEVKATAQSIWVDDWATALDKIAENNNIDVNIMDEKEASTLLDIVTTFGDAK